MRCLCCIQPMARRIIRFHVIRRRGEIDDNFAIDDVKRSLRRRLQLQSIFLTSSTLALESNSSSQTSKVIFSGSDSVAFFEDSFNFAHRSHIAAKALMHAAASARRFQRNHELGNRILHKYQAIRIRQHFLLASLHERSTCAEASRKCRSFLRRNEANSRIKSPATPERST